MNIVPTNVGGARQAPCKTKAPLDGKAAVLWLWNAEDLWQILHFHPDLITLDESVESVRESAVQRVVAVAGQPIQGGRDLLLSTAQTSSPTALDSANISLLITNTQQSLQEIEDGKFACPCLTLDLYEPVQGPAAAQAFRPARSPAIIYAWLVGRRLAAVGQVVEAFAAAFGGKSVAELLIYADEPAAVRSLIDKHSPQDSAVRVRVEHHSRLSPASKRSAWPFDVLIVDDAPGRVQPIAWEAALRGKQIVSQTQADQSEIARPPTTDRNLKLATEMLLAAELLAGEARGAKRDAATFARSPAPARLARRLSWITQAPHGEFECDGLSGVGWVTRWNVKCGIGDHAGQQIESYDDRHVVLAPREESLLAADDSNVFRCWTLGLGANGLDEAAAVVFRERLASVVIHFNWGFYNPGELRQFICSIRSGGRVAILDMHSTTGHTSEPGLRLSDFADCFNACDRVLVHQAADADRVKSVSPQARVVIEPLGITVRDAPRLKPRRAGSPLIASFGFCLPNKGIEELVLATWMLRQSHQDIRLLLLNAEHPAPQSRQTINEVRNLIARLSLSEAVTFTTDYLDEADCMNRLSEAAMIVNPYQQTGESASAAVRFALASTVPVLVTPLPIFDDLGGAVFRAAGTSPEDLANSIRETLIELSKNSRAADNVEKAASKWREIHDLRVQTARIISVAEGIRRNRRAQDWLRVGAC